MFKKIFATFAIFIISLLTVSLAYASSLSVRIEAPKTPTNQNTFKINFVAMDILGGTIDVKCLKKAPGDGSFSEFGSTINLSAGGNTANCEVTSSIIPSEGTYEFKVEATAGSITETSPAVSVEYKSSAPGTPGNYGKQQQGSCQYKISFKTADDGGKTSRVEIYRSDQTSFTADSSTRVGTVFIGSNQDGSYTDTVPDCGKTYYYVIRAFDGAGNGSGVTGDSVTKVIITSTTTSQTSSAPTSGGAIPVTSSTISGSGEILGETETTTDSGTVLGEDATSSPTITDDQTQTAGQNGLLRNISFKWVILVLLIVGGYLLYRKFKK